MAHIILDSMVRLPRDKLSLRQMEKIRKGLKLKRPDHNGRMVTVRAYREENGHICLPRQWEGARRILERNTYDDRRSSGTEVDLTFTSSEGWRKGQLAFRDDVVRGIQQDSLGGIAKAGCGFGKTVMACAIAAEIGLTTMILVHTDALKRQWEKEVRTFLGEEPGIVQEDVCEFRDRKVVIAMVQSLAAKRYEDELYTWPGLVIADECFTGDTLILTDKGQVPIAEIPSSGATCVLTFSETDRVWETKPIRRWIPQGVRAVVRVRVAGGEVRCTEDHEFLTERGWVEAQHLQTGDRILSPVPAAAENRSLGSEPMGSLDVSSWVTRCVLASTESGDESTSNATPPSVGVAAERGSASLTLSSQHAERILSGQSSCRDTIGLEVGGRSTRTSLGSSTGRCLETGRLVDHTSEPHQESAGLTDRSRNSGHATRQSGSKGSASRPRSSRAVATAQSASAASAAAIQGSLLSLRPLEAQNNPPSTGCPASPMRVGLGGTWTMAPLDGVESSSTRKASTTKVPASSQTPFVVSDSIRSSTAQNRATGFFDSRSEMQSAGSIVSAATQDPAWTTSSIEVLSVERTEAMEPVFDLEVEDNHNFVANGLLAHNCHHMSARTFWAAITSFPSKYYLGMTATPRRADGLQNIFFWTIGEILAEGYGDYLDCRVWRVIFYPEISWEDLEDKRGDASFGKFLKILSEDPVRNRMLTRVVAKAVRSGRKILILTKYLEHIDDLKHRLRAVFKEAGEDYTVEHFCSGKTKKALAQRDRAREAHVCLGTDRIAQEGFNIPDLDTLVLALPIKDMEQAAGRIRRLLTGKKEPTIVDVHDQHAFAKNMNTERMRFYAARKKDKKPWPIHTVR